jgi:hypothetical protein
MQMKSLMLPSCIAEASTPRGISFAHHRGAGAVEDHAGRPVGPVEKLAQQLAPTTSTLHRPPTMNCFATDCA